MALIRAGYYDGMQFDRIHHEVSPDAPNDPLDYVEAGCPLDKGDPEDGSIGYWLRAENGPGLTHEIGAGRRRATVGNGTVPLASSILLCVTHLIWIAITPSSVR